MLKNTALVTAVSAAMVLPAQVMAQDINFEFYGSARLQAEYVTPDERDVLGSYTGARDAYSRIGFNADYALHPGVTLVGQLELPLDLANRKVQFADDADEDIRLATIGLEGDFGSVYYGRMWLPYYNAVVFPIDMFNSFYSGFGTFTGFRRSDTISYYSPSLNGFSFAGAWSNNGGDSGDDRFQLTGSYSIGDTTFAVGLDDVDGDDNTRFYGASVMHSVGDWYFGAKIEYIDSDEKDDKFGRDSDTAVNVFASYTMGQHTFMGMLADVDNLGGNVYHVGYSFAFNDALTLFSEFYYEQEMAAIRGERLTTGDTDDFGGGQVLAVGARYDF